MLIWSVLLVGKEENRPMINPDINELRTKGPRSLTPQMSGDLLAEVKRLAREHYLQLKIGTESEFETMWREAFFIHESPAETAS
jgi:hypothetical protein